MLALVLDALDDAIAVIDPFDEVRFANRAMRDLLQIEPKDLTRDELLTRLRCVLADRVVGEQRLLAGEAFFVSRPRERWFKRTLKPFAGGELWVFTDVTAETRMLVDGSTLIAFDDDDPEETPPAEIEILEDP